MTNKKKNLWVERMAYAVVLTGMVCGGLLCSCDNVDQRDVEIARLKERVKCLEKNCVRSEPNCCDCVPVKPKPRPKPRPKPCPVKPVPQPAPQPDCDCNKVPQPRPKPRPKPRPVKPVSQPAPRPDCDCNKVPQPKPKPEFNNDCARIIYIKHKRVIER